MRLFTGKIIISGTVILALFGCRGSSEGASAGTAKTTNLKAESEAGCAETAHALPSQPVTNPFFYRVSKAGKVSYILGTFHVGVAWTDFPSQISVELSKSRAVLMERVYPRSALEKLANMDIAAEARQNLYKGPPRFTEAQAKKLTCFGIPADIAPNITDDNCIFVLYAPYYLSKNKFVDWQIQLAADDPIKEFIQLDSDALLSEAQKKAPDAQCRVSEILSLSVSQVNDYVNANLSRYRGGDEAAFQMKIPPSPFETPHG